MCSVGGVNVFSFGGNVSTLRANVSSFWPDVFTFRPNVFTLAGQVFSEEGERSDGRAVRRMWRKARFALSAGSGQASTSSGQVLRGRRDDGGTKGGRRGMGAAWDVFSRSGGCVQFWGRCVQFPGECVQFLAECVQFRGGCVHFGGAGVQFWVGPPGWGWGADGRRDSSAPLRCARNDDCGGGCQ